MALRSRLTNTLFIGTLIVLFGLTGCGTTAEAPTAAATPQATATSGAKAGTNAVEVKATLREWGLDLSPAEVPAGPVHFVVTNSGNMAHNFTIKDANNMLGETPTFMPDKSPQTLDVTLPAGSYTVYCSLPGHAARGQQNTLVVK